MKYFFPDSQDLVDPSFDFETEKRSELRIRQRDDLYPHEIFTNVPYDGILVSRASVEGNDITGGRYTMAQKQRLFRENIRGYFRLGKRKIETMGDCGAFSYVTQEKPPVTVDEVINFYECLKFDLGVSVDHVIPEYRPNDKIGLNKWRERQEITLQMAKEFQQKTKLSKTIFRPVGVAQGWSPCSYVESVKALQKMNYKRIGLGGMVTMKTLEIIETLSAINEVRKPDVEFHLFGVTRCDFVKNFSDYGVTSFDSTSPLRQAFKHENENYYTMKEKYSAIRVPQVEGNLSLRKQIISGNIDQSKAIKLEKECLKCLIEFDSGKGNIKKTLKVLYDYDKLQNERTKDRTQDYQRTLDEKPWKNCTCEICKQLGIHVVIFRGAERNRRRGFHNIYITYEKLKDVISVNNIPKQSCLFGLKKGIK